MAKRVCTVPGCGTLVEAGAYRGRCDDHRRDYDRARGTRQQRGYDAEHDARRASIQRLIDAGFTIRCWRCKNPLHGRAWHLDHTDDRTGYRGPSCERCNLELAGIKSHQTPGGGG